MNEKFIEVDGDKYKITIQEIYGNFIEDEQILKYKISAFMGRMFGNDLYLSETDYCFESAIVNLSYQIQDYNKL